jgi:hypothetical protein
VLSEIGACYAYVSHVDNAVIVYITVRGPAWAERCVLNFWHTAANRGRRFVRTAVPNNKKNAKHRNLEICILSLRDILGSTV